MKRAVLIGAGHAHLYAAKRAREAARRGFELVVIAPDAFWYSGLATGVLGGAYPSVMDRIDVRDLLGGVGRFIKDEIVGLDICRRTLTLGRTRSMAFDALSLDLGSEAPPIHGAGHDCMPLSRLRD